MLETLRSDLQKLSNPEKAKFFLRFFKTGPGQYGEGDKFIGVTVPNIRILVKKYQLLKLKEIEELLHSEIHEERLLAVLIIVAQTKKASPEDKKIIYDFYLKNTKFINNWDIIDSSAEY